MKIYAEKDNELTNLLILNNKHQESIRRLSQEKADTEHYIATLEKQIAGTEQNCESIKDKKGEDYKLLRQIITAFLEPDAIMIAQNNLGSAWGFELNTPKEQKEKKMQIIVSKSDVSYTIESGESAAGNAQRITNLFKGLPEHLKYLKNTLEEKKAHLVQINTELETPNPYLDQIKSLRREVDDLRRAIEAESKS